MKTADKIHIGSLVEKQFYKRMAYDKSLNKAAFARQIFVDRSTVYKMFKNQSMDVFLLFRISETLGYDFMKEVYSDWLKRVR